MKKINRLFYCALFIFALFSALTFAVSAQQVNFYTDESFKTAEECDFIFNLNRDADVILKVKGISGSDYNIFVNDLMTEEQMKTFSGKEGDWTYAFSLKEGSYRLVYKAQKEIKGKMDLSAKLRGIYEKPLVWFEQENIELFPGQSVYIKLMKDPADCDIGEVKFTKYGDGVTTLSDDGVLTADKPGRDYIGFYENGFYTTCNITVKKPGVEKDRESLYIGDKKTLRLNCDGKNVKWSSSNKDILTVSSKGVIKGKKAGTVTVTAVVDGFKTKCKVTVLKQHFADSKTELYIGNKKKLKLIGANSDIVWTSSNSKIVTVNKNGVIVGKSNGTATVTAKHLNKNYKMKVIVWKQSLSKTKLNLTEGNSSKLTLYGATSKTTWKSSNKKIAVVDSSGKVTAKKEGTVTITATTGKVVCSCTVKVKKRVPIIINEFGWVFDNKNGVCPIMTVKNNSLKTIKNISFDVYFFDAEGNRADDKKTGSNGVSLYVDAAIKKGATQNIYWNPVLYNKKAAIAHIENISVVYSDGKKEKQKGTYTYYAQ